MYALYIMDTAILCAVAILALRLQIIVNPPYQLATGGGTEEKNPLHKQDLSTINSSNKQKNYLLVICA